MRDRTAEPKITEKLFSQQVVNLARMLGWRVYRTWISVHSPAGFPDLVLAKPGRWLILAEIKSEHGQLTQAQEEWLDILKLVPGVEVYVWRPGDIEMIAKILQGEEAQNPL